MPPTVVEGNQIFDARSSPDALARHATHLSECPTQAVEGRARDADLLLPTGDAGKDENSYNWPIVPIFSALIGARG